MQKFEYTWEQAIEILRNDPSHQKLIYDSYLTADLVENCHRFHDSSEFATTLALIKSLVPSAKKVMDLPAGNGIASYAFAKAGFDVVAVEPDPSPTVGRSAIEHIKHAEGLRVIQSVGAYAENLPFKDEEFDVVYIRQGLHHAKDLNKMVSEAVRVTKRAGLIIGAREHVVDDYNTGLQTFLDAQPDHQLYGGENAFTHRDYLEAFRRTNVAMLYDWGPYDSIINLAPNTFESLQADILNSRSGRVLKTFLPAAIVYKLRLSIYKLQNKEQGRLHTFVARKL